jgi:hypothetical protein
MEMAVDLQSRGFVLARSQKGGPVRMIPKDGNVVAVTDQGVAYDLKFGEIFTGTETEAEVGFGGKDSGDGESKAEEGKTDADKKAEEKKEDDKKKDDKSLQKSRYLYVTVSFDAQGLGPKPTAPEMPEEPSEDAAKSPADKPADADTPQNTAPAPDPKKAYEAALAKYERDKQIFESDLKAYENKVVEGEKLVKELNARFVEWYYVVSGNSFENLRQGRKTLVKEKSAANPAGAANPTFPPGIGLPGNN